MNILRVAGARVSASKVEVNISGLEVCWHWIDDGSKGIALAFVSTRSISVVVKMTDNEPTGWPLQVDSPLKIVLVRHRGQSQKY